MPRLHYHYICVILSLNVGIWAVDDYNKTLSHHFLFFIFSTVFIRPVQMDDNITANTAALSKWLMFSSFLCQVIKYPIKSSEAEDLSSHGLKRGKWSIKQHDEVRWRTVICKYAVVHVHVALTTETVTGVTAWWLGASMWFRAAQGKPV